MYYRGRNIKTQTKATYDCMAAGQSPYVRAWAAAYTEHQPWVLAQFECARPNSIIRRSTEQIMYR